LAAIDAETTEFLHVRFYRTCPIALTEGFQRELSQKHDVVDALFLVDEELGYTPRYTATTFDFSMSYMETRKLSNVLKRRTNRFANYFHRSPAECTE